ncbi:hypothetical protein VNO78_34514 [Psophocarpus tetragonolobus]|uniref:Acetyltransferase n=1 Tax=Psophocarpus tetragonolobus TaxID=3891 RepID=A0AAN9NPE0_PSOTE
MMSTPVVERVSECFVKPQQYSTEKSKQICNLTPWDIAMLSCHYIQKGLLFKKPSPVLNKQDFIENMLKKLKHSLSLALFHFYPLSGCLVTQKTKHPSSSYTIFIDCNNSRGARFIYATLDMTISDIISPIDVPIIVQTLFDHHKAVNHDGHTMPLLSVQVTELVDGVFIGCSMNHTVGDGTSYWNFFNTWSEIFQAHGHCHEHVDVPISHPPIHNRWFPEGCTPFINLPFKHHDEFISRYETPLVLENNLGSPRFNMYGNEFGMGKAVAVRSGYANKFDGKVMSYPSHEGGGGVDLEICLSPVVMSALESDQEFLNVVSVSNHLY